jgi:hypothetical protein
MPEKKTEAIKQEQTPDQTKPPFEPCKFQLIAYLMYCADALLEDDSGEEDVRQMWFNDIQRCCDELSRRFRNEGELEQTLEWVASL